MEARCSSSSIPACSRCWWPACFSAALRSGRALCSRAMRRASGHRSCSRKMRSSGHRSCSRRMLRSSGSGSGFAGSRFSCSCSRRCLSSCACTPHPRWSSGRSWATCCTARAGAGARQRPRCTLSRRSARSRRSCRAAIARRTSRWRIAFAASVRARPSTVATPRRGSAFATGSPAAPRTPRPVCRGAPRPSDACTTGRLCRRARTRRRSPSRRRG